jgi:hypothetical protein
VSPAVATSTGFAVAVTFIANAVFPKRKSQKGRKTLYRVFEISW